MHVTQLHVGGLQWFGMQTINLEQILTSLLSHIPAEKDTGMATYLSAAHIDKFVMFVKSSAMYMLLFCQIFLLTTMTQLVQAYRII